MRSSGNNSSYLPFPALMRTTALSVAPARRASVPMLLFSQEKVTVAFSIKSDVSHKSL